MGNKKDKHNLEEMCEFFGSRTCEDWKRCNGYGRIIGTRHGAKRKETKNINCQSYSPVKKDYSENLELIEEY